MKSSEIRSKFLEFFQRIEHTYVPSAPIVLKNDPSLMFTNAGMNQFKDYFLGQSADDMRRAVNSQKCLRVSGKHNDLEEVGVDTYHHTMFEMLGNWSFGDYFKADAIDWAWQLLTKIYGISPENLYITVFGGDEKDGLERDQEAYDLWKRHISEDRILWFDKKDNFWEMGATGPCGPCSEIHIDIRPEGDRRQDARELVNADHPQVIEIWNLVFMEFNRMADGHLEPLPAKHVDTGMGLERLAMTLQGKQSNYDTDVFSGLIASIEKMSGMSYGGDRSTDIAIRVVVDHIRAVSFTIADGQLPANNGAGYVIRRILRRAVRYGYTHLGLKEPFLHRLVAELGEQFANAFPELRAQEEFVTRVVLEEEQSFLKTLGSGLRRLASIEEELKKEGSDTIDGARAFELYDTYGFPFDLTGLIASEKNLKVDEAGFEREMQQQKDRSRKAAASSTGDWTEIRPAEQVEFVGYDSLKLQTNIARFRTVEQKKKQQYQLVLDRTPFYAESGGQIGDRGWLSAGDEIIKVLDTIKENDLIIHITDKLPVQADAEFTARVDEKRRRETAANHSATHLLHSALRKVLGDHVEQRGSLVGPDYLRFDFSHFSKLEEEQILEIERIVNEKIRANIPLEEMRDTPIDEAKAMGAMALFGEKYGERVRVISFDREFSVELCGGTHVQQTGEIGLLMISTETSIASGIRRIEALTGEHALQYAQDRIAMLADIQGMLKSSQDAKTAVGALIEDHSRLRKAEEKWSAFKANALREKLKASFNETDGMQLLSGKVDVDSADQLKQIAVGLEQEVDAAAIVLGASIENKAHLAIVVNKQLSQDRGINAGQIIREISKEIKGGGGGQPFFATAGGKDPAGLDRAIARGIELLQSSKG